MEVSKEEVVCGLLEDVESNKEVVANGSRSINKMLVVLENGRLAVNRWPEDGGDGGRWS